MDQALLTFLVCFGMVCVFAAFVVLMPLVGQTLSILFGVVVAERVVARVRGRPSDSDLELGEDG